MMNTNFELPLRMNLTLYEDERGGFMETFRENRFNYHFVQDNHSFSKENVLRGLHYQTDGQGKLVRVVRGRVIDIVVDIRENSPCFGMFFKFFLDEEHKDILWIPPGFAHGFYTPKGNSEFLYKLTTYYDKELERTIIWNDKDLNIDWDIPEGVTPIISDKDKAGVPFHLVEYL